MGNAPHGPIPGSSDVVPEVVSRTRDRLAASIRDRYDVLGPIDRGGMAFVYLARDLKHGREVAIKVLRPELTSTIETGRFLREIRIAARLRHPHILPIYDSGEADGLLYYVMPMISGETLRERLDREGPLPVPDIFRIARDVTSSLDHAHAEGVVHRDVKPENIFLEEGEALLGDFGIAVGLDESLEEGRITRTGVSVGTPHYMSPEQAAGAGIVDRRTDAFSLGVVLYECVTGRLPFDRDAEGAGLPLSWIADDPGDTGERCPGELARLIRQLLRVDPAERLSEDSTLKDEVLRAWNAWNARTSSASTVSHTRVLSLAIMLLALGAVVVALARNGEDGDLVANHEALITWASQETEGRVRPGFEQVSFLSNREEGWNVWLVGLDGRVERRITRGERQIASHAWSPDGQEVAYLIASPRSRFLEIADENGTVRASVRLPGERLAPRLVRWVSDRIFLLLDGELWSVDPGTLTPIQLTDRTTFPTLIEADIDPRGRRIVYSASSADGSDLWTANLDGTDLVRLTDDAPVQTSPCWLGPEGDHVVYLSNRGGQVGVWRLDPSSRIQRAVATGAGTHLSVGCASDRRLIVAERQEERADLWLWDPSTDRHVRLTSDSRQDFWPSVSDGGRVAFQRTRPRLELGDRLFDADILVGTLAGDHLEGVEVRIEGAFSPWISPDGRWLAYLRYPSPAGEHVAELRVTDLSGNDWLLTARFEMPSWKVFPLDWEYESTAWAPDGEAFYYVGGSPQGSPVLWRARLGEEDPERDSLLSLDPPAFDLSLSPDGRRLSYVVRSESRGRNEVRVLTLDGLSERTLHSDEIAATLYNAGWMGTEGPIVVLQSFAHPDRTHTVTPVLVNLDGSTRQLERLDGAIGGQARLHDRGGRLLLPRMRRDSLTLWEHPLREGSREDGWAPRVRGVPLDGLEVGPRGRLLYSRHEVNNDIWTIAFDPSPPT